MYMHIHTYIHICVYSILQLLAVLFDSAGDGDIQVNDAPLPCLILV